MGKISGGFLWRFLIVWLVIGIPLGLFFYFYDTNQIIPRAIQSLLIIVIVVLISILWIHNSEKKKN